MRVVAVPEARRITASWEVLGTVDVSTLDNLRSSLGDIASVLVEQENVQVGGNRPTLRVVGSDA